MAPRQRRVIISLSRQLTLTFSKRRHSPPCSPARAIPVKSSLTYRRNLILSRMAEVGYVSAEEFNRAKQAPILKKVADGPFPLPSSD